MSTLKTILVDELNEWALFTLDGLTATVSGLILSPGYSFGTALITWNLTDITDIVESFTIAWNPLLPDNTMAMAESRFSTDSGVTFSEWLALASGTGTLQVLPAITDPSVLVIQTKVTLGVFEESATSPTLSNISFDVFHQDTIVPPLFFSRPSETTILEGEALDYNLELSSSYFTRSSPLLVHYTLTDAITGIVIIDDTVVSVRHNIFSITISNNTILNRDNTIEQRVLSVVIPSLSLNKNFLYNVERV